MEKNKTTISEQILLRKGDEDSYWRNVITNESYSQNDMIKLLKDGWKISKFDDSYTGTQTYTHGRITILLEKY